MYCNACGAAIEVLTAQTRAADEAQTTIYTCPKCPLDASKFFAGRQAPHVHVPKSKVARREIPDVRRYNHSDYFRLRILLRRSVKEVPDGMSTALCFNVIGEKGDVFRHYISGPYSGMSIKEASHIQVGPGASLVSYRATRPRVGLRDTYIGMHYKVLNGCVQTYDGRNVYASTNLADDSNASVCSSLESMYIMGYEPDTLNGFISPSVLGAMSNLTARGYDKSERLPDGYMYSTKPDGERIWLTRIGLVWMFTRRLMGHKVICWMIDKSVPLHLRQGSGPCIDLEFMYIHPPILIDILMNETGSVSTQQRTMDWVETEMRRLQGMFEYLPIVYIRDFFGTLSDAEQYRKRCSYPTDGLVAIHKSGVDMFKIKAVKSIELSLSDNGDLSTDDGVALMRMEKPLPYKPGSIVEVKFEVTGTSVDIHTHFLRTDKQTPNKSTAADLILQSAAPTSSSNVLRNQLWRWSNSVRTMLYRRADRICRDKNIIIDVGTGGGQSVESFVAGKSYILVEPDRDSCISLARRLGIRREDIKEDPRSIIPVISRLIRGSLKYHIVNTTLDTFLSDHVVVSNIRGIVGCCVSSFSAQFVVSSISVLYGLCNIPFIGSCYVYDGIPVGGSIIDSAGISMTRTSENKGTVKWGKDKSYTEPVVFSTSLPLDVVVMNAAEEIPYESPERSDPGYKASSHVKILICS